MSYIPWDVAMPRTAEAKLSEGRSGSVELEASMKMEKSICALQLWPRRIMSCCAVPAELPGGPFHSFKNVRKRRMSRACSG